MGLDIRLPIGLMFLLVGALLVFAGVTQKAEELQRSLNINVNLWWGLGLLVFGGIMLSLALMSAKKDQSGDKK
jgi:hypothetical protein